MFFRFSSSFGSLTLYSISEESGEMSCLVDTPLPVGGVRMSLNKGSEVNSLDQRDSNPSELLVLTAHTDPLLRLWALDSDVLNPAERSTDEPVVELSPLFRCVICLSCTFRLSSRVVVCLEDLTECISPIDTSFFHIFFGTKCRALYRN